MIPLRRAVLWAALIAIILLTLLSVYGAFLGAERARTFFNSLPLAFYWFALAALLIAGVILFRRLVRVRSLLLMHAGCILVLLGGMRGSQAGHALARSIGGIDKIPRGQMAILERTEENRVQLADANDIRELPFHVRLQDFRLEYYRPGYLLIESRTGQTWKLPAEVGQTLSVGEESGRVTVRRVFENFKIDIEDEEPVVYDEPGGSNPALEVAIEKPGAPAGKRYVFERLPGHANPNDPLTMSYRRVVSDYISRIEIVKDGEIVAAKDVEVNHPLHYGGYHLYQHQWGEDRLGEYSVLLVVSDSGLNAVYGGYAMLIAGICWHFWGRRIVVRLKTRKMMAPAEDAVPQRHG